MRDIDLDALEARIKTLERVVRVMWGQLHPRAEYQYSRRFKRDPGTDAEFLSAVIIGDTDDPDRA
jgi:hypothetical protein